MSTSPEKPKGRIDSLLDEEEFYTVSEPVKPRAMPDLVKKSMLEAQQKLASVTDESPRQPRWPMFSGILTFPFYLHSLGAWMFITLGLLIFAWLLMFWIAYGALLGGTSARLLGLPTCLAGVLTFGFAASCGLTIIEETSNGWDRFEVSPGIDWKEWIWNLAQIIVLLFQAAMVGLVVQLVSSSSSSLPMVAGTFLAFPLVLLGALAADGAWVPMAIVTVLRSLFQVWWAWGLFYLETGAMALGWTLLTRAGLVGQSPWLTPLYAAPLLATIILIYARLTGRLAACIAGATTKLLTAGDDHENP
jgi:hypothetical protein